MYLILKLILSTYKNKIIIFLKKIILSNINIPFNKKFHHTSIEQSSITKNKFFNTMLKSIKTRQENEELIYKTFYLIQIIITLYIG